MQIATNTRSNNAYAWTDHHAASLSYSVDGLNRYTQAGPATPTYDGRGSLRSAGGPTYTYSSENMLVSATGGVTLAYDPMLRLYQTSDGTTTTRMLYDGQSLIAEYDGSSNLLRRYVHGPGIDEPLVWYEGTGTADRRWLHADERGSIVAISNGTGAVTNVNAYDEYGIPGSTNAGRFQYTGQQWLPELGMYHYRARIYSPTLGRFLQTDPIGYAGGMNLYAYVGNDPVNFVDSLGLQTCGLFGWHYYRQNVDPETGEGVGPKTTLRIEWEGSFCVDSGGPTGSGFGPANYFNTSGDPGVGGATPTIVVTALRAVRRSNDCGGRTGLRTPDFYEFEFTLPAPLPQFGGGGNLTVDRYGRVYAGVNAAFGLPTAAGASISLGWVTSLTTPTPEELHGFLTGASGQISAGYWVGGSYANTLSNGGGFTIGASTPGGALKRQWAWQVGQVGNNPCLG